MTSPRRFFTAGKLPNRGVEWRGHPTRDMILTDTACQHFQLNGFTPRPDQFMTFQANAALQPLATLCRDPYKIIVNVNHRMTSLTLIHKPVAFSVQSHILRQKIIDKSDRLKDGGFTPTMG
jgi:hypothetical protein